MGYSWGEDTGSSGGSGAKSGRGFDYESARRSYEKTGGGSSGARSSGSGGSSAKSRKDEEDRRDHDFSSAKGKTPSPIKRAELAVKTDSTHPGVICSDDTGSFIEEVQVILEKAPLLGAEVERYMPAYALCFALIGDTTTDIVPLQVRDFDKGSALDGHIKSLFPEGKGGDAEESYDLAAYYFTHHCEMPNAVIKPLFIWILDETTRDKLKASDIRRYIGDDAQSNLDSRDVLRKLAEKFTVYVIFKGSGSARSFWADIYGKQSIIDMEDPRDIVELIIGIYAGEAGKFEDFEKRSSKRHGDRPDRVSRVMKSTRSVKEKSKAADDGKGVKAETASKKSTSGKSLKSKKLV